MSFNNHLAFNISKATPTTSTTNTNTISTSSTPSSPATVQKDAKLPLFLAKSTEISPNIAAVSTTSLSGITPTTVSVSETRDRTDLIGLFDKFDVDDNNDLGDESEEHLDPLEEKMSQFKNRVEVLEAEMESSPNKGEASEEPSEPSQGEETSEESTEIVEPVQEPSTSPKVIEKFPSLHEAMTAQPYVIPEDDSRAFGISDATKIDTPAELPGKPVHEEEDLLSMEPAETIEEFEFKETDIPETTSSAPTRPRLKRNDSIQRTQGGINPREQYQQSHKPFDFQIFLTQLKSKSADPIVRYIRSFLVSFSRQSNTLTAPQMIRAIRQFKEFILQKFELYEPFASMDAVDLENSSEGVEKLIMNRLYEFCFAPEAVKKFGENASPSVLQDVKEDTDFSMQLERFSWILGVHLDIDLNEIAQRKEESSKDSMDYLDYAMKELNKMINYRAPRDKIICILNACKIIFSFLKVSRQETNADAFIPLLILVIVRAKTDSIISNLHYIERFRGEEWLNHGETSYYLSSMQGAISFIQNISFDDLTVRREEYDANIEAWEADIRQRPALNQPAPLLPNSINIAQQGIRQSLSPSNVLMASAGMFTKSISNFISPSPQERSPPPPIPEEQVSEAQVDVTFAQLSEIFPAFDKAILKDVIIMNKADFDTSLEVCLQLNES